MRHHLGHSSQGHRSVSISRHFLLQAPQCPCSVRKRFSRDHCCRGRSKPGCQIVGSHIHYGLQILCNLQMFVLMLQLLVCIYSDNAATLHVALSHDSHSSGSHRSSLSGVSSRSNNTKYSCAAQYVCNSSHTTNVIVLLNAAKLQA